jgi:hypothetical protein
VAGARFPPILSLEERSAALVPPDADPDDLVEQVGLGGEREVHGLLGDAGLGGDLRHRVPASATRGGGFVAGFHLRDPQTGKGYAFTVYENADAAKAAGQRMQARPADKRVGAEPDTVEWLEAHPF